MKPLSLMATSSGVPVDSTMPPPRPPSGPMSIMWSANFITSRLCSIITTVLPLSTSFCSTFISIRMSSKCSPVVGSSRMYIVLPVSRLLSSVASFTRWLSPPDSVVDGCPSLMYPRPTSCIVFIFRSMSGTFPKNSTAWLIVMSSTSAMLFPLYLTSSVSRL